jgi:hypothetical protein
MEHTYTLDGQRVPAVSDVLEPLQVFDNIPPAVLEKAREIGTAGHEAIALMLQKQLDWATLDPKLVGYVLAAQKCVAELEIRVLSVETRLADPGLKVAGTLDILGILRKRSAVIDWKLTEQMPRTAALQTAAYDHLYRRSFGGRPMTRYGAQLFGDGSYKIFPFEDQRDYNWFFSALNLWHWRQAA